MFITKDYQALEEDFNWSQYFGGQRDAATIDQAHLEEIYKNVRTFLKEDNAKMGMVNYRVLRELFAGEKVNAPRVLEIGAATGFLTRSILGLFGGTGLLVDRNEESHRQFTQLKEGEKKGISYLLHDLFTLELEERFDLVCSFGLIEHFVDKKEVVAAHCKFAKPDGRVLVIVPMDTPLSRAYFEVNPELNLGYRELMTKNELIDAMKTGGLEVLKTVTSFGYTYDYIAALGAFKKT